MAANEALVDSFTRVWESMHRIVGDLSDDELNKEPHPSIGWLAWRLTRVEDSNVTRLANQEQLWIGSGWAAKFGMPPEPGDFGRGVSHTREQVRAFKAPADLLLAYHDATYERMNAYLLAITPEELARELDEPQYTPLPTVSVRIVSVLENCLHNLGQMGYLKAYHRLGGWFPGETPGPEYLPMTTKRFITPISLMLATLLTLCAVILELGDAGRVDIVYAGAEATSTVGGTAAATGTTPTTAGQGATPSPTAPAATATAVLTSAPPASPTVPIPTTVASTLPDLLLVVSASPDPVAAGQILSYFLTVQNNGNVISGRTSVVGDIPDGTSVNSLGSDCTEDRANGIFRCQVQPQGPNQQVSFQVNLNVTATSGILQNRFAVDSENAVVESDETNNLVDRDVQVLPTTPIPLPVPPTATPVTIVAPPDPGPIIPLPAPVEPTPVPPPPSLPVEPAPLPEPEPAPPPPASQLWLEVLESTPAVSNDEEVLWDAMPGEWYFVVMEEGGWALVVWEGDPPEFTEWIEVDSRVQLGLY